MQQQDMFPKWVQDLKRFKSLKSVLFLYGNVYDAYYFPKVHAAGTESEQLLYVKYNTLPDLLTDYFKTEGFKTITYFDVVDGLKVTSQNMDVAVQPDNLLHALNITTPDADRNLNSVMQGKNLDAAISLFRLLIANQKALSVGIINFASRFTSSPNALEDEVKPIFMKLIKAAQEFQSFDGQRNLLILICDKLNDIPAWVLHENPLTKGIEVHKPRREERIRFIQHRANMFYMDGGEADLEQIKRIFPDLTEDFSNRELENLQIISRQEKIPIERMKDIIDLYKYGLRENPWEMIDDEKIVSAPEKLGARVLGQDQAIRKAVEIIRRAKLGLDAIDRTRPSNKPKGVLFFAGPTGTGKTELAKSLAELIFSDEDAMIRFDMSEYNDVNSDVKFIGSPPGYVGYEEGGQLTDAIREKPFSIVLFDEIEKAHPKIFDKFLQILDDGRLTDGKGETVYFSQCLIIFTSNLGMYSLDEVSGIRKPYVVYEDDYPTLESKIQGEIKSFFGSTLGRPEIYNRFGDNFVVFDFIRKPIASKIAAKNLAVIKDNLKKLRNIDFEFDGVFIDAFLSLCDLSMGGRGIVNQIESHIKNGLTNYLFEKRSLSDCRVTVSMVDNKVIFS